MLKVLRLIATVCLFAGIMTPGLAASANPVIRTFSISVDGYNRTYTVSEPANYRNQKAAPLVVMLHGVGGTGAGIIEETGWGRKSEQEGFLVVFPDALRPYPDAEASFLINPQVWNDGSGRGTEFLRGVNDVKFLSLMLDQIAKSYKVDANAVFLAGFSNGASLGFKAVTELPGRFKAFAAVSGHYWPDDAKSEIGVPTPTLFIVGTADPLNPFEGGTIQLPWGSFTSPPLMSTMTNWAGKNGLRGETKTISDTQGVKVLEAAGEGRVPIRAYIIEGLGHLWPGGVPVFPESYIGKDPGKVNATDLIWDFFSETALLRARI